MSITLPALRDALLHGRADELKHAVEAHPGSAALSDGAGNTLLHIAAEAGLADRIPLLVSVGCDPCARNKDLKQPLMVAAARGDVECMLALFSCVPADEWPAFSNHYKRNAWPALMYAAKAGSEAAVGLLLSRGADVHAANKEGATALYIAARESGNPGVLRQLAAAGASVNLHVKNGRTPLLAAIAAGNAPAVDVLVRELHADILGAGDASGLTPFHEAAECDQLECFDICWEAVTRGASGAGSGGGGCSSATGHGCGGGGAISDGAAATPSVAEPARNSATAPAAAAATCGAGTVSTCSPVTSPVALRDSNGRTALHYAAMSGAQRMVVACLAHGWCPDAADERGATPAFYAAVKGHLPVLRLLVEAHGAAVNPRTSQRSALHGAAIWNNVRCCAYTLQRLFADGCRCRAGGSGSGAAACGDDGGVAGAAAAVSWTAVLDALAGHAETALSGSTHASSAAHPHTCCEAAGAAAAAGVLLQWGGRPLAEAGPAAAAAPAAGLPVAPAAAAAAAGAGLQAVAAALAAVDCEGATPLAAARRQGTKCAGTDSFLTAVTAALAVLLPAASRLPTPPVAA